MTLFYQSKNDGPTVCSTHDSGYVKSEAVYACPSDSGQKKFTYYGNLTATTNDAYGSYGIGRGYSSGSGSQLGPDGKSLAQIEAPAATVLLVDAANNSQYRWTVDWNNTQPQSVKTVGGYECFGQDRAVARHSEVCNVVWADGHVKSHKMGYLATPVGTSTSLFKYWTIADD